MPILRAPAKATHEVGTTRFTSLVTPSRGASETSVWQVELAPGTPATPHSLTREETFVVLDGTATVRVDGQGGQVPAGDAILVPAGATLELSNPTDRPVLLLCCLPVGGQAQLADGTRFSPPWAL